MSSSIKGFTFKELSSMLRTDGNSATFDAVDRVAGLLLVLSPIAYGPAAIAAVGLLDAKSELVKIGREAIAKISADRTAMENRYDLMSMVYALSCYTAFFDAADKALVRIRKEFKLEPEERLQMSATAEKKLEETAIGHDSDSNDADPATFEFHLPHPTSTLETDAQRLIDLYTCMTVGLEKFIVGLSAHESLPEHKKEEVRALLADLPIKAVGRYKAQYLALCTNFNEFYVWSTFKEHELTRNRIQRASGEIRRILEVQTAGQSRVDLGLKDIRNALTQMNSASDANSGPSVIRDLHALYEASIGKPIAVDEGDLEGARLAYPRKEDIFVPQQFRVLRYHPRVGALENEDVWNSLEIREAIAPFILSSLSSPYSDETPLVLLGHPGTGKSLLTEMLAARLVPSEYTPIRIELRDINADSDIQSQIEQQIRLETGQSAGWTEISGACSAAPPLVILDGYDELLQASGRVFSSYLLAVAQFQERERTFGRPVKVLVTSRVTLIDKAQIPLGTTVIRLEDFDEKRQDEWIRTWNSANSHYFSSRSLQPLQRPSDHRLQLLARQPLLLLMLALYDSKSNELLLDTDLNQTLLYDNLLRRFIDREHNKGADGLRYRAKTEAERSKILDEDMERLGVAAIGMYNRRALHISRADLEADITHFSTQRVTPADIPGVALGQAELLLGSFFFVHESRSKEHVDGQASEGPAAFEFLHNTFGEFLTADFILANVIRECELVRQLKNASSVGIKDLLADRLNAADGLPAAWFGALMFTPLHSRPVVLQMLQEWSARRPASGGVAASDYWPELETILHSQLQRLLVGFEFPQAISSGAQHPFPKLGVMSHAAIFSLNLVLLRTALTGEFRFSVDEQVSGATTPERWRRLTHLWRCGMSFTELESVGRLIRSRFTEQVVIISSLEARGQGPLGQPGSLRSIHQTAAALGDDLLEGLAGWAMQDSVPISAPDLASLADLPGVISSGLDAEVRARQAVREIYSHGLDHAAIKLSDEERKSARLTSSGLAYEAYLNHDVGSQRHHRSASPSIHLVLPAEISALLEKSWGGLGNPGDDDSDDEVRWQRLVRDRAIVAADSIYSLSRISPRSNPRYRDESRVLAKLEHAVRKIAEDGASDIPSEVALEYAAYVGHDPSTELILGLLDDGGITYTSFLGRSTHTFDRVVELSEESGRYAWIDRLTDAFRESQGPTLLIELGMYRAMRLLVSSSDRSDLGQGLNGMLDWMLRQCPPVERTESLTLLLKLLRRYPRWATHALAPEVVISHFGFGNRPVSDVLGRAGMEDYQWLVDNWARLKKGPQRSRRGVRVTRQRTTNSTAESTAVEVKAGGSDGGGEG